MTDETTLPPVKEPNTWRVWLKRIYTWGWAHTVISGALLGAACGFVAGKIL